MHTLLCRTVETPLEDEDTDMLVSWHNMREDQGLPSEVLNRIAFHASQQMRIVAM